MEKSVIHNIVIEQKAFFETGKTRSLYARRETLSRLEEAIRSHQEEIALALKEDLGKSSFEAYMTEIGIVLSDLRYIRRHLGCWMRKKYVLSPLTHAPAISFMMKEPYGCVLILSPWNYPFQLSLEPLIGALAAGNTAIVKPSAYAPSVSRILKSLLSEIFPDEYVCVIEGGRAENTALLEEKVDYIFFTGSPTVGKTVLEKASVHLTPVSLELGGKSPCIVTASANLALAAKRIAFGKWLNAGQTCVAPDYLFVEKSVEEPFLELLKDASERFYGEHPLENENYPKIITQKHFERIHSLMKDQEIVHGGRVDPVGRKIEPTILRDVPEDAPVMQEEIFGPVLPVLTYRDIGEVIEYVRSHEKPLALYLFSEDEREEDRILNSLSFGGGCINDTVLHVASHNLPFGGVGASGMGSYHGKFSFETFSHTKSIVKRATWFDFPVRYAPYTPLKLRILKLFL